jgi:hypothetical protein
MVDTIFHHRSSFAGVLLLMAWVDSGVRGLPAHYFMVPVIDRLSVVLGNGHPLGACSCSEARVLSPFPATCKSCTAPAEVSWAKHTSMLAGQGSGGAAPKGSEPLW